MRVEGSGVDTAIWTKPCGDLAGQLLYGDSLQMQQFRADSDIELCRKILIAVLALMACSMHIALPNRTIFQLPAKRV